MAGFMNSLRCPECGNPLEDAAVECPHCGFADTKFVRELNQALDEAHGSAPAPDYTGEERRRHFRVVGKLRLMLDDHPALLIDISKGGLRASADRLPSNPEIEILLFTPERSFRLKGRICWVSRQDSLTSHREAGIEFLNIPEDFQPVLEKIMNTEKPVH